MSNSVCDLNTAVLSQTSAHDGTTYDFGHSYPASAANCRNGDWPEGSNCRLRIMCAASMPSNVAEAEPKDLKPFICLVSFLMNRWSCSMMLFRGIVRLNTDVHLASPTEDSGGMTYGGYSRMITVNRDCVLTVPEALDPSACAPLLCAGITTYSPLRHWKVGPGTTVGVIGLGGLGHKLSKQPALTPLDHISRASTRLAC